MRKKRKCYSLVHPRLESGYTPVDVDNVVLTDVNSITMPCRKINYVMFIPSAA